MKQTGSARLIVSATVLAVLGACMSGSGTGSMGGSAGNGTGTAPAPSGSAGTTTGTAGTTGTTTGTTAAPVAPTNTGTPATPGAVDTTATTKTPPTGAANSQVGTGTAVASVGTGLTGQPAGAAAVTGNLLTTIGSDARIVSAIDVVNTDEIAAAMLARERAQSPRVRAFAEHMITDHTRLQGSDRAVASNAAFVSSDSADITREMRRRDNASMVRLRAMPAGSGFDAAYLSGEIADHKEALALLNASKTQAQDPRVRDLAAAAIPIVQDHLNQAMALQQGLGPR